MNDMKDDNSFIALPFAERLIKAIEVEERVGRELFDLTTSIER